MSRIQDEIQQIVGNARDVPAFYNGFLKLVAQQTDAISGIAWACSEAVPKPFCQVFSNSNDDEPLRLSVSETEHLKLIQKVSSEKRPLLVFPKDRADRPGTDFPVILMVPVLRQSHLELVELFLKSGSSEEVYKERFSRLQSCCNVASKSLSENPLVAHPDGSQQQDLQRGLPSHGTSLQLSADQIDQYVHQLHLSLDPSDTAKRIANETRRILDCDRVSVIRMRGSRARIQAISGQPSVNRRSSTVQLLEKVARKVLATKKLFWFPTNDDQALPPQIEKPLNEYLSISSTRTVAIYPIFDRPPADLQPQSPRDVRRREKLIGGLVVEQLSSEWERPAVGKSVDLAAKHSANAYRAAHNHGSLFGYPVWKWLGKSHVLTSAKNLPKTAAVALGLLALTAILCFVPADFKVSCEGQIVPEDRRNVFAEVEGVVGEIYVDHGDTVVKGGPLLKLENPDMAIQRQELEGLIEELDQRVAVVQALQLSATAEEQAQMVEQNLESLRANLESYRSQLETLEEKAKKLNLVSPIEGRIISWDVREQLRDRPIQTGEVLLEVAKIDGEWILEIELQDRDIGHVLRAQQTNDGEPLLVDFKLAADPSKNFKGRVTEIGNATAVNADQQQVASLKVAIDDIGDLDIRQARSGVIARIHCGRRKLGFVWLRGPWEFIQKTLFKYW